MLLELDGHAASVPSARRAVQGWLRDRGHPAAVVDRVGLLVTELVDNAVRHARPPLRLRAAVDGAGVRVEVADGDPRLPAASRPAADALSGRGLWLVSRLADRWGAHPDHGGKIVWAAIATAGLMTQGAVEAAADGAPEPPSGDGGGGGLHGCSALPTVPVAFPL